MARALAALAGADLAALFLDQLVLDQNVACGPAAVARTRMKQLRSAAEVRRGLRHCLLPSLQDELLLDLARRALGALPVEGSPHQVLIGGLVLVLDARAVPFPLLLRESRQRPSGLSLVVAGLADR